MVRQMISFALVGMLNTAFCYLIFLTLLWGGLAYALAMLIATIVTIILSYFMMGNYVFKSKIHVISMTKFLMMHTAGYFLNISVIRYAIAAGISTPVSGAISLSVLAIYTFLISRFYVFAKSERV